MIEIRKSMLTMGSIICLFVLISISYQPIVADEPIEQVTTPIEISIIEEDCPCDTTPAICSLLDYLIFVINIYVHSMELGGIVPPIATMLVVRIWDLGEELGCW